MMDRRHTGASLVLCLLFATLAVAPVGAAPAADVGAQFHAAQENPTASAVEIEYPDCDSVRITGDAGYAEVHVAYIERGGFDTELRSFELSGDGTVLGEDDLFPNGVGSYQDEFIVAAVTLFESKDGPAIGTFENPDRKACFEALPRPPENTVDPSDAAEPTTTPPATETTAPPSTTPPETETSTTPPATPSSTTTPQNTAPTTTTRPTTAPPDTGTSTTPQNAAPASPAPKDPEPSQEGGSNDSGADDEAGGSDRTNGSFSANASTGANETLVTYNVTGRLVNATDNATVTANGSEQAPNGTRAPTVEDDGFEAVTYLAVNDTADETAVENLSVDATVNESHLASLDGNASDVQLYAWDAANGTWIPLNTSVSNATDNSSIANAAGNVSVANATGNASMGGASQVFEADIGYGVYAVGLDRPHFVVTDVTAPENVSVNETFTVGATVENTGRAGGTPAATLSVAGTPVEESEFSLGANESTAVRFDWRFETPGTHTVAVDGRTVEVNVSATEEPASSEEGDPASPSASTLQSRAPVSLSRLGAHTFVAFLVLTGGVFVAFYRE